jgi:uncharacterized membrane protein
MRSTYTKEVMPDEESHCVVCSALILLLGSVRLARADSFTYTTIDFSGATATLAAGINNSSQIVGAYDLNTPEAGHVFEGAHGFLDNGGTFTAIDDSTSGVTSTTPKKINDSGNIVGVYRTNGPGNGFLDVGGVFTDVNFPGGVGTHDNGINNTGEIVGQYKDTLNGPHHGFLDNAGVFSTIDFPGATNTIASVINSFGDIVGFYDLNGRFGFLDKGGNFVTISFPGATGTEVYGINDQGDIVGAYQDQSGGSMVSKLFPFPNRERSCYWGQVSSRRQSCAGVGDFNRDQPPHAQPKCCEELIRYLRQRCGKIGSRYMIVRPHRDVNPPRWATDGPGDAFIRILG